MKVFGTTLDLEHCTGIAEVMGSSPVEASFFFLGFLCNCLSYFTTAKITFTSIFYLQCMYIYIYIYDLYHMHIPKILVWSKSELLSVKLNKNKIMSCWLNSWVTITFTPILYPHFIYVIYITCTSSVPDYYGVFPLKYKGLRLHNLEDFEPWSIFASWAIWSLESANLYTLSVVHCKFTCSILWFLLLICLCIVSSGLWISATCASKSLIVLTGIPWILMILFSAASCWSPWQVHSDSTTTSKEEWWPSAMNRYTEQCIRFGSNFSCAEPVPEISYLFVIKKLAIMAAVKQESPVRYWHVGRYVDIYL